MALISAKSIVTSVSLFHLTIAYFMLFNPRTVDDQIIVYILGRSMGLPAAKGLDAPSPSLAFLAVILALFGLTDLMSLSMPEELGALYYWGTQAPMRFILSMCVVFYSYLFSSGGPLGSYASNTAADLLAVTRPTDGLKNRVVFTFMFIEMVAWFWLWLTLREERNVTVERLRKQQERNKY